MKNLLFQFLVLLPLAIVSSTAGALFIYGIYFLTQYGITGVTTISLFGIEGGVSGQGALILVIGGAILLAALWLIDFKVRGITGAGWIIFDLIIAPLRLFFQWCAIMSAFGAILHRNSKYISTKNFPDTTFGANLSSVLFNYYNANSYAESKEKKAKKEADVDETPKSKKRFGETHIKVRNILMQLFVLLPLTGILLLLWYNIINPIIEVPKGGLWDILVPILWFIALIFISMIVTQLKGHEIAGDYWEKDFRYKRSTEYGTVYDNEEHEYDPDIEDWELRDHSTSESWKKTKGGWTTYIRPITILCIIFSPILVFFQVISLLIAIFSNPYKGRLFSWYGDVNWDYCNCKFLQKLLHFFFGFVILKY